MAETLIPPWILPVTPMDAGRLDDLTSVFSPRFARGRTQRNVWADPRWSFRVRYQALRSYEASTMRRALAEARGRGVTIRWSPGRPLRGSFLAPELLSDGVFANGTANWTGAGTAVLTAADRLLRSGRTSGASNAVYHTTAGVTTSGVPYVGRVFSYVGKTPAASLLAQARLGTSAGGSELGSGNTRTDNGMSLISAAATGASTYLTAYDDGTGKASGDYHDVAWASLSRCLLVNGASQTGSALIADGAPISTNGLLLPGDMFEVGGELKECTAPVNSDSSGNIYIRFRPGLARAPADNAPIILNYPMGRFLLGEQTREVEELGTYLAAELDLVEAHDE